MSGLTPSTQASLSDRVTTLEGQMVAVTDRVTTLEREVDDLQKQIAPDPAPPLVSPVGDVATSPEESLRYASGATFKITPARKISRAPSTSAPAVVDAVTANVIAIGVLNPTTLVQRNTADNYYTRPHDGPAGAWTQILPSAAGPLAPVVVPPAPGTYFSVKNGTTYKPDGSPFKATGVDIWWTCISNRDSGWGQGNQVVADFNTGYPLLQAFPDLSAIRMACFRDGGKLGGFPTVAELRPWVDFCTRHKIVLVIDPHDYSGGSNYVLNNGDGSLPAAVNFLKAHAAAWKGNAYVWAQSQNEPGTPCEEEMGALYDAWRGQGNDSVFMLSWVTYDVLSRVSHTVANRMKNVVIDRHCYAIGAGSGNMNVQAHIDSINREVAAMTATFESQDGKIPILCFEFGDACCGSVEQAGLIAMEAVCKSAFEGWSAWNWTTGANRSWGVDILNDVVGGTAVAVKGGAVIKPYMIKG